MLMSRKEVASYLGVSVGLLDRLVRQGAIHAVRIGRRVLFRRDVLEEFTRRAEVQAGDPEFRFFLN